LLAAIRNVKLSRLSCDCPRRSARWCARWFWRSPRRFQPIRALKTPSKH